MVKRNLKHWLLPHKGNQHHPHILRPRGLAVVAAMVLGVQLLFNLSVSGHPEVLGYATDISPSQIIGLTNQQRNASGLGSLREDSRLDSAAYNKAQYMFSHNYWAHTAPDGTTPWYFIRQAGYAYATAGENLAKDFSTSSAVVSAWMNSSEHRANILNSGYVDTGVAVVNGTLLGEQTTLVVAFYASPAAQAAPVAKAAAPPPAVTKPAPTTTPVAATPAPTPLPATPSPSVLPQVAGLSTVPVVAVSPPAQTPLEWTLSAAHNLGWGRGASLLILFFLLALYGTHFWVIRRVHPRHTKHLALYNKYPVAQASALLVLIAITVGNHGLIR